MAKFPKNTFLLCAPTYCAVANKALQMKRKPFMRTLSVVLFAIALVCISGSAFASGPVVLDLKPESWARLGSNSDLGQVFIAPTDGNLRLDSFNFYAMGSGGDVNFTAGVYPYDRAKNVITGAALYVSNVRTALHGTLMTFQFDTGGVALQSGASYLAVMDRLDQYNPPASLQVCYSTISYPYGDWRGSGVGGYSGGTWYHNFEEGSDLGFKAVFTPEPATLSILALASMAMLRRRKIT